MKLPDVVGLGSFGACRFTYTYIPGIGTGYVYGGYDRYIRVLVDSYIC